MVTLMLMVGALAAGQEQGILVMAHGGDDAWNKEVQQVVAPLQERYPTEIAFGMARTSTIREAVHRLEQKGVRRVAVVRMFVSGESFLAETEYILGLRKTLPEAADHSSTAGGHGHADKNGDTGHPPEHHGHGANHDDHSGHGGAHHMEPPEPITTQCTFVLSRQGLAESPLLDEILTERVHALSKQPNIESVLLLAHGPADDEENARWLEHMEQRVGPIRALGSFREVRCVTLREDWPEKREAAVQSIRGFVQDAGRDGGRCIVVPFRVSGFGPYGEVLEGLEYVADQKGFCPHPNLSAWIERTALECFAGRE